VLQAIELVFVIRWKIVRSRFQTREEGCFGVNLINFLVLSKIEMPMLVRSIVQSLLVRLVRANKVLVMIESGKVYEKKSVYSLLVGIRSVPLAVALIIVPLAVFTRKC